MYVSLKGAAIKSNGTNAATFTLCLRMSILILTTLINIINQLIFSKRMKQVLRNPKRSHSESDPSGFNFQTGGFT